ncbi:unnamed protein product, partial [Allacma fusca]
VNESIDLEPFAIQIFLGESKPKNLTRAFLKSALTTGAPKTTRNAVRQQEFPKKRNLFERTAPSEAEDNQVYRKLFAENVSLSANKKDCWFEDSSGIFFKAHGFIEFKEINSFVFALVDFVSEKGTDGTIPCEMVHFKWISKNLKKCYWPGNKNYIQEFKRGGEKLQNWKECDVEVKFVSGIFSKF